MKPIVRQCMLLLCLSLALSSCTNERSPFLKIKEGMTQEDVIKLVGHPESTSTENDASGEMIVWQYRGPKEPIKRPRSAIGTVSMRLGPSRDQADAFERDKRIDNYVAPLRKIFFKNNSVAKIKTTADIT